MGNKNTSKIIDELNKKDKEEILPAIKNEKKIKQLLIRYKLDQPKNMYEFNLMFDTLQQRKNGDIDKFVKTLSDEINNFNKRQKKIKERELQRKKDIEKANAEAQKKHEAEQKRLEEEAKAKKAAEAAEPNEEALSPEEVLKRAEEKLKEKQKALQAEDVIDEREDDDDEFNLNKYDEEDIKKFIEKSGQTKKQALFDTAMQMTKDYEIGEKLVQDLDGLIKEANDEVIEPLQRKMDKIGTDCDEIDFQMQANREIIKEHEEKQNQYRESAEKKKAAPKEIVDNINKKQVDQINKILEKQYPKPVTTLLESFIGLLRNSKDSTNIDVELYFKAHDKLVLKLEKIDPSSLDFEIVQYHKTKLTEDLKNQLMKIDKYMILYDNLFRWAVAFVDWATDVLMYDQEQEKINEVEGHNRRLELQKKRAQAVRDALQEDNLMDDVRALLSDQLTETYEKLVQRRDQDYNEAKKYQEQYHNFESRFNKNIKETNRQFGLGHNNTEPNEQIQNDRSQTLIVKKQNARRKEV